MKKILDTGKMDTCRPRPKNPTGVSLREIKGRPAGPTTYIFIMHFSAVCVLYAWSKIRRDQN